VRKGGEWQPWCGEAETRASFIGVGRGDCRPSGGQRCTIKVSVTQRRDDGAAMIHGEIEEVSVAHRFSSI
jgi:hypothetical protein